MENWLVVLSGNQLLYLVDSEVTSKKIIIMITDQLCADNFWYIKQTLVTLHHYYLNLFSVFLSLFLKSESSCLRVLAALA